jgi:dynactin 5
MKIGDHVHVGANSVVEAAQIGNHVEIGKNCVIVSLQFCAVYSLADLVIYQGKFTIIKDCAKVADNTFVPPNTVIPALSLFAGSPGKYHLQTSHLITNGMNTGSFVEDLPESTQEMVEAMTKQYYTSFQPDPSEPTPAARR